MRRFERVAEAADDLTTVGRLARDLPNFLRTRITREQAWAEVRAALQTRDERFLWLVDRAIYAQPRSPYRALLQHAGCELGDVRRLVQHEGLDGALSHLLDRGVYVTDDEMKGRQPIVRGSLRLTPSGADFRSRIVQPHVMMLTGGSSGRAARVPRTLRSWEMHAANQAIHHDVHGVFGVTLASWVMNPASPFISWNRIGNPLAHWLLPLSPLPLSARIGAQLLGVLGRRAGVRFPPPTPCEIDQPETMARVISTLRARHGRVSVSCATSAAVRAAMAARDRNISLAGVTFDVRSEPLTEARRQDIEAAGAHVIGAYGSNEITYVAFTCANRRAADDMHLFAHEYALTTSPRETGVDGETVQGLHVTTLSPFAPVIGLNAQMGDVATVEERDRDCCPLGGIGLTTHLSNIRSYDKLTGEGVTVARSDMLRVLEVELPRRFGGASVDYQLAEEAGPDSLVRLVLRISPRVGALDEDAARAALLAGLDNGGLVDRHMAMLWRQAGTVVIRREEPRATAAGKVLPFHRDRRA